MILFKNLMRKLPSDSRRFSLAASPGLLKPYSNSDHTPLFDFVENAQVVPATPCGAFFWRKRLTQGFIRDVFPATPQGGRFQPPVFPQPDDAFIHVVFSFCPAAPGGGLRLAFP